MNGPEHYRAAERLLAEVANVRNQVNELIENSADTTTVATLAALPMQLIAHAQVHALLATAAATAQNIRRNGPVGVDDEGAAWSEVLS